ncbi:hypothetical protein [Phaffia rhodozyma]|uniref:Uncharacterized protein n=1 Tax=Phaffia rhodozyma TaxID=264483 RepID=A0A0F7SFU0_PHARH|nr:hypothetical protein [Phaffia rhodozyma]
MVSTTNTKGLSSGPSIRGGIGIWGACLEQANLTRSSQLRLCTFASPLSVPKLVLLPGPLPTLPSYLPPYFSPVLSFFLVLALACALIQHALRSYILWGEIAEYGRISTGGKKDDLSDGSPSYQPDAHDGPNRFGGSRWKNMWETVSREIAVVTAQSCIIVIGILLFPLLPSIYILTSAISSIEGDIVTSMLFVPGWGTALLVLSVICTLNLRSSTSRSHSRSRFGRSTSGHCRRSSMLPFTEIKALQPHNGHDQDVQSNSQTNADREVDNLDPPLYRSIHPLPLPTPSSRRKDSPSQGTTRLHSLSSDQNRTQMNEQKEQSQPKAFWVPVSAFAEMSEGEADASETINNEGMQVVQVEIWA